MEKRAALFTPPAEVVASAPRGCVHNTTTVAVARSDVVAMVRRRPCPLAEIASGLGVAEEELQVHLTALVDAGVLRISERDGVAYYVAR
jgi:DNA-binding transcriptional ArsR family regulator